ncbi:MAG: DUF234 domain-containing protein [Sulfurimonas sp.]|nr:DUF234 domain-containing protein [Sulfurimonas sp.]
MILSTQTLLEQFQSFYKDNKVQDMADAIEKFALFGGVAWDTIDTSKDSFALIEKLILPDYRYIRNDISEISTGMPLYHLILTGIAQGDGQTHTAYRRANVSQEVGDNAIASLCELGIIKIKKSKKASVSNKLYFNSPFLRFWFAFVSPLFKGIKEQNYKEIQEKFANNKSEFINLIFEQLSLELVKVSFDESFVDLSSYWDEEISLDIYAKTKSQKLIVGSCKYTNAKVKKSELTKLQEKCAKANIKADIFVIVSKSGFSNELKALKGNTLKLLSLKNFKNLL